MAKKIFIAATMQNDGKTTVSLGLIACLKKRFGRIGFIKPIGQRYLVEQGYKVDEDSVLIEGVFGFKASIKDMSPLAIERGFTERYIEKGASEDYARIIKEAFDHVAKDCDLVIVEGTGHAGVGSVFDLSNATVARLLEANVILISSGGVGKPIDEVMLNKALFDKEGVRVAGVVVNKVRPEKFDRIAPLVRMGFEKKGLEVFGALPYQRALDLPTMREIREEIKVDTLYDGDDLDVPSEHVLIGAMNVRGAVRFIQDYSLMIIPGDRDDLIRAVCEIHLGKFTFGKSDKRTRISGIILSGGMIADEETMKLLKDSGITVLATVEDTYSIASRVHSMIVKLKPQDSRKIEMIVDMIEKYVDIDKVIANLK